MFKIERFYCIREQTITYSNLKNYLCFQELFITIAIFMIARTQSLNCHGINKTKLKV
jgi:hypothetical protein